jgi:hypothetical protein
VILPTEPDARRAYQTGPRSRSTRKTCPVGALRPPLIEGRIRLVRDIFGTRGPLRVVSEDQEYPGLRGFCDAPERIRTSDLRFRRPTLYPAELRAQVVNCSPVRVGPGSDADADGSAGCRRPDVGPRSGVHDDRLTVRVTRSRVSARPCGSGRGAAGPVGPRRGCPVLLRPARRSGAPWPGPDRVP